MFYDETPVKLRAGNGGDGAASFRREKFLPKGGPDGGDGGKGGDVILQADENVGDLRTYHFQPHWEAGNGERGRGRQQTGASGADRVLLVPPGTVVFRLPEEEQVAEVLEPGKPVVLLNGGKGGLGNLHFKSSINQAPRKTTPGVEGETGEFRFVLKTIADIGLVGFPNAGKSTLTGALTNAKPKAAAYPFTTLHPSVGIIDYPERYERLKLADIPGLIPGAHENKGLGHRFLRHIERCRVLLLIIDMAGGDDRDPRQDYEALLDELRLYDPALLEKRRLVAANKMDEPSAAEHLAEFKATYDVTVVPIAALLDEGLETLKEALYQEVKAAVV